MTETMQRIALASRPMGAPVDDDFLLENIPMPVPAEGEVLVKVHYMSLDPYMRGRMDDAKSYAADGHGGGVALGIIHASAHVGIKRESMEAHKHFALCRYWQWLFDQGEVAVLRRADGAGGKGHLLHRVAHLVSVLCSVPR